MVAGTILLKRQCSRTRGFRLRPGPRRTACRGIIGTVREGIAPDGRARLAPVWFGGLSGDILRTGSRASIESTIGPNGAGHPRIGIGGTVFRMIGRLTRAPGRFVPALFLNGVERRGPPGDRASGAPRVIRAPFLINNAHRISFKGGWTGQLCDQTKANSSPVTSPINPNPQLPCQPLLLQGDRPSSESAIGSPNSVVGIVGIRNGHGPPQRPLAHAHGSTASAAVLDRSPSGPTEGHRERPAIGRQRRGQLPCRSQPLPESTPTLLPYTEAHVPD